jgi:hypothetical protein
MSPFVALGVLLLLLIPLGLSIGRASELFVVRVREGSVRLVRGRAPARLLADIGDVVARPPVPWARIRVVTDQGRPRVIVRGDASEAQRQQLRNVVGLWSITKIRAGSSRPG